MASDFVHLHCHSEYSLLDGLAKIKKLVTRVKEMEMSAVALTDHGVMYGAIDFYKECLKQGVKPLIGIEAYTTVRDHHIREGKSDNNHLVLVAKNYTGYKNLMKLATIAHLEGFYYKPRFSRELLRKYSEGLVCTSACPKGEVAQALVEGKYAEAKKIVEWFGEVFGGDYYLEVQRHFYKDYFDSAKDKPKVLEKLVKVQTAEDKWVEGIIELSRELGVPVVATNDVHYVNQSDAPAQDALVCISTGKNIADMERLRYIDSPTFYLRSPEEMAQIWRDFPDAVQNTGKAAEDCGVQIELGKWYFPKIELPEGRTAQEELRERVYQKFPGKYPKADGEMKQILESQLEVIISKGYASYLLLMADLVNWCESRGIITNTRGSAAGSMVCYILDITRGVDPVKYNLPPERFLNPLRPKAPDIDLDVADDRREELIGYIVEKYGQDKVAQICTFGRMLARAAVRDVARVMGQPYAFGDRIAKVIPLGSQGFPMTIDKALDISTEFKALHDSDGLVRQTVDLAREIEGNARHASVHAAGTVVAPTDLTDYTPLQREPNGTKVITQYEMHACEDVGLVKFDILGIRNLSILGAARDLIESERGVKVDLAKLPQDDKKTFAMLARGETMGCFQLGGSGMTKWLKELKPTRVEDIMIMIALFRPGPMANIPEFIARKNRKSPVAYLHPKMQQFLDKSYGILVYQEDILYTALALAGYTWASVDALRQAIGKKKPKEMAQQHEIFVEGCQKHSGMTGQEAEKIWELFVPFQGYGFNKAHAASYGIVSYQTAYLKANYPVEYMTALLTAEAGNAEKIVEGVEECRRMGVVVLPPDINTSQTGFCVELNSGSLDGRAVRFGFSAIKNVGQIAIDIILRARDGGEFKSFTDFCLRVDSQKVNRKVLESLIKAGAMDRFGKRAAMLAGLDRIREMGLSVSKLKNSGQTSLFAEETAARVDLRDQLPDVEEFEKERKLGMEKDLLGFYLSEHPHGGKIDQMQALVSHSISELDSEGLNGQRVVIGGVVESCRSVITKSGNQPMCFATVSDLKKTVDLVVFPKVYGQDASLWQTDKVVLLGGKVESRDTADGGEEGGVGQQVTVLVDVAVEFSGPDTVLPNLTASYKTIAKTAVEITIARGTTQTKLVELNDLLQRHKGDRPANLVFVGSSSAKVVALPYGLKWTKELKEQVDGLLKKAG